LMVKLMFGHIANLDGNENSWFCNDKTCCSNDLMTSHNFLMQGCLLSNALNVIRISSTMCTKLAQVSQNPFLFMLAWAYLILMRDLCWWVLHNVLKKSCPSKVDDNLFNKKFHLLPLVNH
jgi:hypothetical protein